jgi:hypothetical protein
MINAICQTLQVTTPPHSKNKIFKKLLHSHSGGLIPNWLHSVRRSFLAYCTWPGRLWEWRIWWNEDLQGKPKYSEKTCPSAILSNTNPTCPDPGSNPGRRRGSQRLTAWAMARPKTKTYTQSIINHVLLRTFTRSHVAAIFTEWFQDIDISETCFSKIWHAIFISLTNCLIRSQSYL